MIISLSGETKISNRYLKNYKKMGYKNIKQGDIIYVPIEKLSRQSTSIIEAECNCCKNIIKIKYNNYNNRKNNKYYCKKCATIKSNKSRIKPKIEVECVFCGNMITTKKYNYNLKIKNNNKYSCSKCCKEKYKKTCLERYGVDNISKLNKTHIKIKKTCLKKYGDENYKNQEKKEKTNLKKYGCECSLQNSKVREKSKKTCLNRYGFENPTQCPEIFSKQQKSRYNIKKYKNTNIFYQGTYEFDFLDNYYNKINIVKPEPVNYSYCDKNKIYFPDFYLPEYNLIVEIKSSYTFEKYKEKNLEKEKMCLKLGYNFIFIVNKDYNDLNDLIKKIFIFI